MNDKKQITVFGATGNIGAELIPLLSTAGISTIAVTRDIRKAVAWPSVQWVTADMADKKSLYAALAGSSSVFLLSGAGPDFVAEQCGVIDVSGELGIRHIVKLSSGAADPASPYYIPRIHGEAEAHLVASGMSWTMLRPNGIMQNWLGEIARSIQKDRCFSEATGDGKRAHVDRRDIAEVAFRCLTEPAMHTDKVYLLTSDLAVNYSEVAGAISKEIGEEVTFIPISPEEARSGMSREGLPFALAETFLAYDEAQRNHQAAVVTDHVRNILGKPARTLEQFVRDYVSFFR